MSEGCLYIDVYTPQSTETDSCATSDANGLPVMIWIQGGAFVEQFNPNYNGTGIVEASGGNAIVVTFNYRVGTYGFWPVVNCCKDETSTSDSTINVPL
jgi:acetylcholinesterase